MGKRFKTSMGRTEIENTLEDLLNRKDLRNEDSLFRLISLKNLKMISINCFRPATNWEINLDTPGEIHFCKVTSMLEGFAWVILVIILILIGIEVNDITVQKILALMMAIVAIVKSFTDVVVPFRLLGKFSKKYLGAV